MKRLLAILILAALPAAAQFDVPATSFTVEPFGTDPGETGRLRWKELPGGGQNVVELRAPDALTADVLLTWFDELPASTQVLCVDDTGQLSTGCNEFELPNGGQISWADSGGTQRILLRSFDGEFAVGHVVAPATGGNTTIFSTVGTTSAGMMVEARDADGVQVFRRVTGSASRAFLGDNNFPWEAYIGHGVNLLSGGGNVSQLLLEDHAGAGEFVYIMGQKDGTGGTYALHLPLAAPSTGQYLTVLGSVATDVYELGWGSGGAGFYQTVQEAGTARTQRAALNFLAPFTATDDGANSRTNIACATCVTTNTTQTISGAKTFTSRILADAGLRLANNQPITALDSGASERNVFISQSGNVTVGHSAQPASGGNTTIVSSANSTAAGLTLEARSGGIQVWRRISGSASRAFLGDNDFPWEAYIGAGANLIGFGGVPGQLLLERRSNTSGGGAGPFVTLLGAASGQSSSYALSFPITEPSAGMLLTVTGSSGGAWDMAWTSTLGGGFPVGGGRTISTTSPLTGGGDLTSNRTIACATCVTTDTTQSISGVKTFSSGATFNGGIIAPTGANSTLHAGSGGALYMPNRGIGSGSVSCGSVADGWIEITTDDYLVSCRGGTRYRVALASY